MNAQNKNLLTLTALVGVAAAVLLYAYFGVMKADEAEQAEKDAAGKLFVDATPAGATAAATDGGAAQPVAFDALTVTAKGDTTVLEKVDGKWRLTAPVKGPADSATVEQLVAQLGSAKLKAVVEEKPADADLERFGLKAPRFTLEGSAAVPDGKGGTTRRTLKLAGGIENTFDGSTFVRRDPDPKVHSVDGAVRFALERSTYELRDKEVLAIDEPKLRRLEVKTAKGPGYTLDRDGATGWRMVTPATYGADGPTVTQLLGALRADHALSFPADSPAARTQLGLDAPALDARFVLDGGATRRIRLARTTPDGGGEKVHALIEDADHAVLAEVSAGAIDALDKSATALRDRKALHFDTDAVAKVVLEQAGKPPITVERTGAADAGPDEAAWTVTSPDKHPAKKWKMASILWSLGAFRTAEFGPDVTGDGRAFGLDAPARRITLHDRTGVALARLTVGKAVPGKAGQVYARGTPTQVLELEAARLAELPSTLEEVADLPIPDGGSDRMMPSSRPDIPMPPMPGQLPPGFPPQGMGAQGPN